MLEEGHTSIVTRGIGGLVLLTELVNNQENGVVHNQHALVSSYVVKIAYHHAYIQEPAVTYIIQGMEIS